MCRKNSKGLPSGSIIIPALYNTAIVFFIYFKNDRPDDIPLDMKYTIMVFVFNRVYVYCDNNAILQLSEIITITGHTFIQID